MDKELEHKIDAQLLNLLYKSSAFSLLISAVITIVLGIQFWGETNSTWALVWFFSTSAIIFLRYILLKKFKKEREKYSHNTWVNMFYTGIFFSGCLWGATGLFYDLQTEPFLWFFILFILTGITGGAFLSLTPYSKSYILLTVPAFSPIIINSLVQKYEYSLLMALFISLYVAATSVLAQRSNKVLRDATLLRIKHETLTKTAEHNLELFQQQQNAIEEKEEYMRSILNTSLEAILTMNENGIIELVNPAVENMFGYNKKELIGKNISSLMPNSIASFHQNKVDIYMQSGNKKMTGRKLEAEARRKNGEIFPVSVSASDNIINGRHIFTGIISDITEQRNMMNALQIKNDELKYLSSHDELTGIYNRRSIDEYMHREWDRAFRQKANISTLMLDVDNFKNYNDNYGHQAGDLCLQRIAKIMKETLRRPSDYLGRYGGEEFIVILPETDIEGGLLVAENLRDAVESLKIPHEKSNYGSVTISIGIASTVPKKVNNFEKIISCADKALYEAKSLGRNCIASSSKVL